MDIWRTRAANYYAEVAQREGVKIIYGHSRGGAIVADMPGGGYDRVGLDSAMVLAENKDMLNIRAGIETSGAKGIFDEAIGYTGKNDVEYEVGDTFHKVWK